MIRTRPVTESDLPLLARLDEELFPQWSYPYFVLRQLFDLHGDRMLVLDDGGVLVGYAVAGLSSDGRCGWVLALGVDPGLRGRGLGRRLLDGCLRGLREDGADEVRLTVDPANAAALTLYGERGFAPVEQRDDYFGPGADRLVMVLPLRRP
ncbi:Mycothiol acetyltransferase [Streptomyces sp. enrichment culture]|uniref:GNAT family N-acetyltransferase n=1 Tax=Streptomyces sp. enrichment culture TaxID=1795815 RepID=UPI003F57D7E5